MSKPVSMPARPGKWPRRIASAAAIYAIAGGGLTLLGWGAGFPRVTDWNSDGAAMFPNTAACVIASGLALLLHHRRRRLWHAVARILSGLVVLVSALTLVELITGINLGLDTTLFKGPWGDGSATAPMSIGPPAAFSLLLVGCALVLLDLGARARVTSVALGITGSAIASLFLIGHGYGAHEMYTLPLLHGIAMQSASMILALGVGVVASIPEREPTRSMLERSGAGILARQTLPVLFLLSLMLGWMGVKLQNDGVVDTAFGTALRTLIELVLFTGLLWRAVGMIRQHELALQESEEEVRRQASRLAAFLDTAAIGLHSVNVDGIILWVNDAELQMLGYDRREYVGHHIAVFHDDQEALTDILSRLHRGEKIREHPARMRCSDGSIKSVLIDSSVLRDEKGSFLHTQCFVRDVTELKLVEAEREENSRRKDEFIAILAHELRNPLAPVRNAAYYLKALGHADTLHPLEIIERQVSQMTRLIDDLLDVSRITRGVLELRRRRVPCGEVVEAAVDACRAEVQAKGQTLRTVVPDEHVELEADRERLVQVFCNLLGNASKYTPPGGHLEFVVEARNRDLHVRVRDDGIGIPPERLSDIFGLFVRVDHSLEKQGGLGIGLTLARQIVELHGGTLEARSQGLGTGSEFVVSLPVVVAAPVTVATGRVNGKPVCIRRCVLVADDSPDAVESLSMLLALAGHDVHPAFDGEEALQLAETLRPDVALLDIGMPKANGYQVARRIRHEAWGKDMVLVAVTGWGQEADKLRAQEAGFDVHLLKPVSPEFIEMLFATLPAASGRSAAGGLEGSIRPGIVPEPGSATAPGATWKLLPLR